MWIGIFGEKIAIVSDNAINSDEKFRKHIKLCSLDPTQNVRLVSCFAAVGRFPVFSGCFYFGVSDWFQGIDRKRVV
ncbi:hypothetical protein NC99_04800 [Sunxiuqinia dokdonensis]|uniref:Uncharacterized protein n=1 Tax=Sunxiuqinia dokdonensis TaxID=1409788 RepID=A0A0L8VDV5_9BACT|nr:hypothetical protein NC99_04800 [Sunxiuqinia dokdonensis]